MTVQSYNRYHPLRLQQDLAENGRLGSEFQREVLQDETSFISYVSSYNLQNQFVGTDGRISLKHLPPDAETFLFLLHKRLDDRQIQNLIYVPSRQCAGMFGSADQYTGKISGSEQSRHSGDNSVKLMELREAFFDAVLGAGTDEIKLEDIFVQLEGEITAQKKPELRQDFKTLVMDDPRAGQYSGASTLEDILAQELSGRALGRMTALATLPDSNQMLQASYNTPTYKNIVALAGSKKNIQTVFSSSVADILGSKSSLDLQVAVFNLATDVARLGQEAYDAGIFAAPPDRENLKRGFTVSDLLLLKNIYGQVAFQIEEMRNLAATMDGVSKTRKNPPMEKFEGARQTLNQALTNLGLIGTDGNDYKSVMQQLRKSTGTMLRESITFKMQEGYGLSSFEQTARAGEMGSYVIIGALVTMTTMGGLSGLTFTQAAAAGGQGLSMGALTQTAAHCSAIKFGGSEEMEWKEVALGAYTEQFKTAVGVLTGAQLGRLFIAAQKFQKLQQVYPRIAGALEGITSNVTVAGTYVVTDQTGLSMGTDGSLSSLSIDPKIIGLWALSGALSRGVFSGAEKAMLQSELAATWKTTLRGYAAKGIVLSKDLTLEAGEEILETLIQDGYITPDQVLQSSMAAIQELGSGEHVGGEASRQHMAELQRMAREQVEDLKKSTPEDAIPTEVYPDHIGQDLTSREPDRTETDSTMAYREKLLQFEDIFLGESVLVEDGSTGRWRDGWQIQRINSDGTVDLISIPDPNDATPFQAITPGVPLQKIKIDLTIIRTNGAADTGWQPLKFNEAGNLIVSKRDPDGTLLEREMIPGKVVSTGGIHAMGPANRTQFLANKDSRFAVLRQIKKILDNDASILSRRDFVRLFPGEPAQANVGNCYLVAALHALWHSDKAEVLIRSSMRKNRSGNTEVRIPLGSASGRWIEITNTDIAAQKNKALGQKEKYSDAIDLRSELHPVKGGDGYSMTEAAYMKARFGEVDRNAVEGGLGDQALKKLLGDNVRAQIIYGGIGSRRISDDKTLEQEVFNFLNNFDNRNDMATANTEAAPHGHKDDFSVGKHKFFYRHAYAIESVNKRTNKVVVVDPRHPKEKIELTYQEFCKAFSNVAGVRINYDQLYQELREIRHPLLP